MKTLPTRCTGSIVLLGPWLFLWLLLIAPASAFTKANEPDQPQMPTKVREFMMSRNYAAAQEELQRLQVEKPNYADFWLYLEGSALLYAQAYPQAIETLGKMLERYPDSRWRFKARFLQSEVYRVQRKFKEAEEILEAEASRLRSDERQKEIASVYLLYADQYSGLVEEDLAMRPVEQKLNFGRAFLLYQKVLDLGGPEDLLERTRYGLAYCRYREQNHREAIYYLSDYLKIYDVPADHVGRKKAEQVLDLVRIYQAKHYLGLSYASAGQPAMARRIFEDQVAEYDGVQSELGRWAREFAGCEEDERTQIKEIVGDSAYSIGAFTHRTNSLETVGLAVAALNRFIERFAGHSKSFQAYFMIGDMYRKIGAHEQCIKAFDRYLDTSLFAGAAQSVREKDAELRRKTVYLKGVSYTALGDFVAARNQYEEYVNRYSFGAEWAAAQQGIVDSEYEFAAQAWRNKKYPEARKKWSEFLLRHPLDPRARLISFDLGKLYYQEALDLKDDPRKNELLAEAIQQWHRVAQKYPQSEEASEALYLVGVIQEQFLLNLEEAIRAYRSCSFGAWAQQAAQRLSVMTKPSLVLKTERTWRTNQEAKVKAQIRNVRELQVQLYQIDLEAYFRKHLTHRNVESLDLDLIAPNSSFRVDIEDYADYKPIEKQIVLPVEEPGVWAVAVSAENMRATTLVLKSDLDLIVKSSPRESLVFVLDMRSGQPAGSANVLFAMKPQDDSSQPRFFVERTTNMDGVARLNLEPEWDADSIQVLVMKEGSFASDGLQLTGLSLPEELQPRGFVHTDRPVYRPGHLVFWRAILRNVEEGQFHFQPGERVQVEIMDPQGRLITRQPHNLSDFGSIHGKVQLDEHAPVGQYRIVCQFPNGPSHEGRFEVEQYTLPEVQLEFDLDRTVYYRGEEVEVALSARYYFGEPVTDSPVSYQLPDGTYAEGRTDQNGELRFSFSTRDFPQESVLNFSASLTEEQVAQTGNVYLAIREFRAQLNVDRDVYLAGTAFPIRLQTQGPDGEPLAKDMHLQVLHRESIEGGWRENIVQESQLRTDAESGRTLLGMTLDKGGHYIFRAQATDRFDNPILAETSVYISGDEDAVKLRIFADSYDLELGTSTRFNVHNRLGKSLALITYEGDSILGYQVLPLVPGENDLELAIEQQHFPNFVVSASVMHDRKLHLASAAFDVSRKLNLKLKTKEREYRPGEEVELEVTATDHLGLPIATEFSLAAVDAALMDLYPGASHNLKEIFEAGFRRTAAFRTTSSCNFEYLGTTNQIAEEVLAEQEGIFFDDGISNADIQIQARSQLGTVRGIADSIDLAAKNVGREIRARTENILMLETDADMDAIRYAYKNEANFQVPNAPTAGVESSFVQPYIGPSLDAESFANYFSAELPGLEGQTGSVNPFRAETAYWVANVTTDENGKASVRFSLPDRNTRWRLQCLAVTKSTLVSENTLDLTAKSGFFVRLRTPSFLRETDQPEFEAEVHNLTGEAGPIKLMLRIKNGEESLSFPVELAATTETLLTHQFPPISSTQFLDSLQIELEATAQLESGEVKDLWRTTLPIRPWNLEFTQAKSGTLTAQTTEWLELPTDRTYQNRYLDIYVGPSMENLLVQHALGGIPEIQDRVYLAPRTWADHAAHLLAVSALLRNVTQYGQQDHPEVKLLNNKAQSLVRNLILGQRGDGGWAWIGTQKDSMVSSSVQVMIALGRAKQQGLWIPQEAISKGVHYLRAAFQRASQQDYELKASLLYGLAIHDQEDFGGANRLHRNRRSLSSAALAYLTLALAEMDRVPMAAEVATVLVEFAEFESLEKQGDGNRDLCSWSTQANSAWLRSKIEMAALGLLALQRALPNHEVIQPTVEYLQRHRPWGGMRSKGWAIASLAHYFGNLLPERNHYEVILQIANLPAKTIEVSTAHAGEWLRIPLGQVPGRRVRVEMELKGRGKPTYSLILRGVSSEVEERHARDLQISSHNYLAPTLRYRGREVQPGFNVLRRSRNQWQNTVEHLEFGQVVTGQVKYFRRSDGNESSNQTDFLVLEIPLPPGARLYQDGVEGTFHHWEERDGSLFIHVGQHRGYGWLNYQLIGSLPGDYQVLPATLKSAYDPNLFAVGKPTTLKVLSKGAASPDSYKVTPDELYELGKAHYQHSELNAAAKYLEKLYGEYENELRDEPAREVAEMLLYLSLKKKDPPAIVRYFEVLKERNPELTVPFDKVLEVGKAYRELEEYERALLIFTAVIEETFGKDIKVAATLEEQGEFAGAVSMLGRLWEEFPDSPAVLQTWLTLSDKYLKKAPQAHQDSVLVQAGMTQADLVVSGVQILQHFLGLYPEDPLAPEAGLNLVSAYLDLEDYAQTAKEAGQMSRWFAEPKFADAFTYTEAVALWYLGKEDRSLQLLTQIASAEYVDANGVKTVSLNRNLALYILGQIYHARREIVEAMTYYEQVKDLFTDAREILDGFRKKEISLPEVTQSQPGTAVELKITYRNVKKADLLVYAVDLMTLYLREKNLSSVTEVNLAGIAPTLRQKVDLGSGNDLQEMQKEVSLQLPKAGAYLVLCRGDELHSSGLVLVSDLELEVAEEIGTQRVRVQVVHQSDRRYLRDVDISIISQNSQGLVAGQTDPRGLFVADGVQGATTVIARLDDSHYAFHRSENWVHRNLRELQEMERAIQLRSSNALQAQEKSLEYFQNVFDLNDSNQMQRKNRLNEEIKRERKGVQVKQVR